MAKYYHDTPEGKVPFTPEQEAQRDAEIAAWEAGANDRKAAEIRKERDRLIAETDWVTLRAVDVSVDGLGIQLATVWTDYRQALRDITNQPTFPDEVIWPTKPE